MEQGKIVKGVAGFYYVSVVGSGIYECKAKGIFRKEKIKPLVGDEVQIDILDAGERTGNIVRILPRKNALIRPAVANIDQAMVVFAVAAPKPNLNLLDRFLLMMEQQDVPAVICFNKRDLADEKGMDALRRIYAGSGYPLFFLSAAKRQGVDAVKRQLAGQTTVLAGPSGVGKSTLINLLAPKAGMETGAISEKIQRGRHTTRHAQLICLEDETFLFDTPGFTSLSSDFFEEDTLAGLFPEFVPLAERCRFSGCRHIHEPDCAVRAACEKGEVSRSRYASYIQIFRELQERKKY